ncbi:methylcrotonoyl-CoA carboxylase [candidate division WOR-3 bacterium 4484_100]|uniref:Methylcrotonoyl-CoA carboxylase n=1 Tax=candidate division WOR-3 bacterium 4484_100 TaxID=1936077 RepID=A0A1V4QGQ5_UNCW3|nr:MAG: methylcrotonoyl-CoA carboxylase [candidate division WOR-3 bacterium 4484_100]
MERLESHINPNSPEFKENKKAMEQAVKVLRERLAQVRKGGPPHMHEKHKKRNKLFVRERLKLLFDPDTPFLELSPLAAWDMYDNAHPAAAIITGVGIVHNKEVMVVAHDATVKGGTYIPETIKKHIRAQEIAMENRLPCIYLVDSGGIFLPLQVGTFPDKFHFGRIFYNQARMSAENIPQISVVLGFCTAGGAYQPAMSDEVVIVKGVGTIYIGGPPLVKAATGEVVTEEELGGADVHCRISGVADHYAEDDEQALMITRNIIENLPEQKKYPLERYEPKPPAYDPAELYGIIPADLKKPFDMREVIARIVDNSEFQEFKALYGTTLVCGFARIMGYPVGILANNGVLFSESSQKGAHFVSMCAVRRIPILFLQNITGFIVGKRYEHGGIAKDGAKLIHAVANAQVPKFTIIVGNSYGAGNYGMCGRAYGPRLLWMWPTAKICVMGGEQAAGVLTDIKVKALTKQGKKLTPEEIEEIRKPILAKYEYESSAYYSTARLWDDGIIDPLDTREILGLAISMSLNAPIPEHKFGVFRM